MKARLVSSTILGALALGLFGGPLATFADQTAPAWRTRAITIEIDRTRKGDRAPALLAPITTIEKSTPAGIDPAATERRLVPVDLGDCEPLASPVADRTLGKWAGRCVV